MKQSEQGLVPAKNLKQRILLAAENSPQTLKQLNQVDWRIHALSPLIDSANMRPENWQEIADTCLAVSPKISGIVIVHGTDTLAYTASALAFLLANIEIPVIITGSQKPLSADNSDALHNFSDALNAACHARKGVWVSFHHQLFPAARVVKKDAVSFDGFDAPRWRGDFYPPKDNGLLQKALSQVARHKSWADIQIAVLTLTPGFCAEQLSAIIKTKPNAIILSAYSIGTLPNNDPALLQVIKTALDDGILICAVSQCYISHVNFSVYAVSAKLAELGLLNGADMTLEAAYCKLMVLIHLGYSAAEIKTLFSQSLVGEMTDE